MRLLRHGLPLTLLCLAVPLAAQTPMTLTSPNPVQGGAFGRALAGVPDLDGDGIGDVLVGAFGEESSGLGDAGRAYVYSGATGNLRLAVASPNAESGGYFGYAVAGMPDVDGDRAGEILVGALVESPGGVSGAGQVYLFSGGSGALIHSFTSPNIHTFGFFGQSVSSVPDTDGDGVSDVLVGAMQEHAANLSNAGRAYLFSGATGALLHTLTSPNAQDGGLFGHAVAGVPDTDGDGAGDLLVSAEKEDDGGFFGAGRVYLFSGASGTLLHTISSPTPQDGGRFGFSVDGLPDTDGDGAGDLLVGAHKEAGGGVSSSGRAYLFSGASGTPLHTLLSPNAETSGRFGYSVAGGPDADGDGVAEIIVGTFGEDVGGLYAAGRAYVFNGNTGGLLQTYTSPTPMSQEQFGRTVAATLDVTDLPVAGGKVLVGAWHGGASTSQALIYPGSSITADEESPGTSMAFRVSGPNPIAGKETVTVRIAEASEVSLALFDVLGRLVDVLHEGPLAAGRTDLPLDAGDLAPGTYVMQGRAGGAVVSRSITVLR